jgi:hypothetical protein
MDRMDPQTAIVDLADAGAGLADAVRQCFAAAAPTA